MIVDGFRNLKFFDTVLVAIGRDPNPDSFGAKNAGI